MRRQEDGTHACSQVSQDGNPSTLRPRGCHPLYSLASGLDTGEYSQDTYNPGLPGSCPCPHDPCSVILYLSTAVSSEGAGTLLSESLGTGPQTSHVQN